MNEQEDGTEVESDIKPLSWQHADNIE